MLLAGAAAEAQAENRVLIVKSSDNAYFNQSINTLIGNLGPGAEFEVVLAQDFEDGRAAAAAAPIVVALGQAAAEAVQQAAIPATVFNAYLTHEQYDRLKSKRQTTVLLDQPLSRYLAFCRLALGVESVGVILPGSEKPEEMSRELLDRIGLELTYYRVDEANKLLPVLRRLLRQDDSLLMLPRQSIYNRDSLKGVLLTGYRSRKPVISYSPAHVRSGALASIYSSPADIGKHLALLLRQKMRHPQKPLPEYEYARFYSIASNRRVARALSIDLPDTALLRRKMEALEP